MAGISHTSAFFQSLCRANASELAGWMNKERGNRTLFYSCITILVGCGLYGWSIGLWRSPLQGFYSGIKLPLLIFFTCLANSLLNSILAMVLGSRLSFRQTSFCVLLSFSIFSLIVGAISPVSLFLTFNTPNSDSAQAVEAHSFVLVINTFFIAYAGILGNWKLYQLLAHLAPSRSIARRTLFAWLAGNLFLGAQLSWVLRPFFGNPSMEVQFLRDNPMRGNFYEILFGSIRTLLDSI